MRIDASNLNFGFMQKLQAQKKQGEDLGSAEALLQSSASSRLSQGMKINSTQTSLTQTTGTLSASAQQGTLPSEAPQTIGQTVANEIIRRMDSAEDADGQPKDATGLRDSIASTLDWVRDRYGDETATAAAAMVLGSTSDTVDEESLGEGFLNVLKFIDRNQGIAAGDEAIARFNSGINSELNNNFDNGQSEIFYAMDSTSGADQSSATQDITSRLFMRAASTASASSADTASAAEQLLESLKAELDKTAELQDFTSQLEVDFAPTKATTKAAMAAYTAIPVSSEPVFTSMAV